MKKPRKNSKIPKATDPFPIWEVHWEDAEEHGEVGWNNVRELLREAQKPCHSHISIVNHRTSGVRKVGEDPNRLHQGEEGPVGTFMTITAARRGARREPPPNVRCAV